MFNTDLEVTIPGGVLEIKVNPQITHYSSKHAEDDDVEEEKFKCHKPYGNKKVLYKQENSLQGVLSFNVLKNSLRSKRFYNVILRFWLK